MSKKECHTIDKFLKGKKLDSSTRNAIFNIIKHNRTVKKDLLAKTSYLDDCYLAQPISQRLYHYVHNLPKIPCDKNGWYFKYKGFLKGYDAHELQDIKQCKWHLLKPEEIKSYTKSVNVRQPFFHEELQKHTAFLDQYKPSPSIRNFYYKKGINYPIVNLITGELASEAIYRKIDDFLKTSLEFEQLKTDEKKIIFLKNWLNLSGKEKKARTQHLKFCMPVVNFILEKTKNIKGLEETKNLPQLAYHVINCINELPKCAHCSKTLNAKQFNLLLFEYPLTCSHYCNNKCAEVIEKRLKNNNTNQSGYMTNVGENEIYILKKISKFRKLNLKFNKQVGQYIVDGIDESKKIAVEVQEKRHAYERQFLKDKKKINFLLSKGYKVILALDGWFNSSTKPSKNQIKYKNYFTQFKEIEILNVFVEATKVLTNSGWSSFLGIKKSETKLSFLTIVTESEKTITCTEDHLIFFNKENFKPAKNFKKGEYIQTIDGVEQITDIVQISNKKQEAYDVVETQNLHFLANDIQVHNCVMIDECAFIECLTGDSEIYIKDTQDNTSKFTMESLYLHL